MSFHIVETAPLTTGTITYRRQGEGNAVVLLHGLAGNARSWEQQFATLAQDQLVVAWDAPGYGGSALYPATADAYVDALHQVLEMLNIEWLVLVGHSMGGILAARYAARYGGQLAGLVLSCTYPGDGQPLGDEPPATFKNRVADIKSLSPEAFGMKRAKAMVAEGTEQSVIDSAADIAAETRAEGLENAARILVETDNAPLLAELKMPTLLLTADQDPIIGPEKSDRLSDLIGHAQRRTITGAGHAPYLEQPDAYNSALTDFISGL